MTACDPKMTRSFLQRSNIQARGIHIINPPALLAKDVAMFFQPAVKMVGNIRKGNFLQHTFPDQKIQIPLELELQVLVSCLIPGAGNISLVLSSALFSKPSLQLLL